MENIDFVNSFQDVLTRYDLLKTCKESCERSIQSWAIDNPDESKEWNLREIKLQFTHQACYFESPYFTIPNIELTMNIELGENYFGRYVFQCDLNGEFLDEYLIMD
ncbi:hypothetical protein [Fulvivirga sp.]|uniref:hypothetical protein n=1 Tax=Fulvivirga sp. TaxID=1931237 RepID=UPI0032EF3339